MIPIQITYHLFVGHKLFLFAHANACVCVFFFLKAFDIKILIAQIISVFVLEIPSTWNNINKKKNEWFQQKHQTD